MKLIKPSIEFIWMTENPLQTIEYAGRTCYKSEDRITSGSAAKFVKMIIDKGHEAMLEHTSASYRFICDRGVTHEIVRHRLFSYAQESTRYCNYKGGVTFIIPCWMDLSKGVYTRDDSSLSFCPSEGKMPKLSRAEEIWLMALGMAEEQYQEMIENNWTPQQARTVLPNSLKTEIVITGNFREWRHFFKFRCAKSAHPQMQEIANMALSDIRQKVPVVFDVL